MYFNYIKQYKSYLIEVEFYEIAFILF